MNLAPARPSARANAAALAWALLTVLGLVWSLRHLPPLGTDGLIYHLPLAAWWRQDGWLAPVDLPFHGGGSEHQPALAQTVSLLLMHLTGDDGLVWLVQPVCWLAIAAVFLRSARLVGAGRELARGLTALLLLFPPLVANAQLPNNDLSFLLGTALALHGLLLARRRAARGAVILGLGLGLALAVKSTGTLLLLALGPFALAAGLRAWRDRTRQEGAGEALTAGRRRLLQGLGAGAGLLLLGSAFLWRNLLVFGNPLWPGRLRLLGRTVFEGPYDLSILVDHGWAPSAIGELLWDGPEQHALTLPWSPLLWLGWGLCWFAFTRAATRRRGGLRAALVLGFPPLHFLLAFGQVPFWVEPRYHLPTYYALWLALALGLAQLRRREREARPGRPRLTPWLPPVVLLLIWLQPLLALLRGEAGVGEVVEALLGGAAWLAFLAGGLAALAVGAPVARGAARQRPRLLAGASALLVLATWASWPDYRAAREERRGDLWAANYGLEGEAWQLLLRAAAQDGPQTIAYAGTPHVYPLFGARLQNRVVYLRLSADDRVAPLTLAPRPPDVQPGFWMHESIARARRARVDDAFWLAELERLHPGWLLLAEVPHRGGVAQELALIARHPQRFQLVAQAREPDGRGVWLYRVR